ncbi:hypothetical protein XELAEV_18037383mg [Xenopus laevis]|uniref:Uncharacterized protein n=1 Tax=Xenopus laevis TaxID=8355 RepID=A0A974CC94_XENLA|nr:hypothetical protein XELAEV_18037383mg [Xenopus laevis]
MKLLTASILIVLLAVCTVSAEEESILSSVIGYVQGLSTDAVSKATDAVNTVKDLPLAQNAMELYDTGAGYVTSFVSSAVDFASDKWQQLTKDL